MFLYSFIVIVAERGTGGPTSRQITKQCFLRNSGPDTLENHRESYPASIQHSMLGQNRPANEKKTHLNGASLADFVYLEGICKLSFCLKKRCQNFGPGRSPLPDETFWIRAWLSRLV